MLNVLINAYAVSPNWGSEPGVGWNWIINLANHCNVFVITESEWKDEIEAALINLPQKNNIHFYFNPVPDKVRKMCWNQGDWRFYWYYRKWQQKTLRIAQEIIKKQHIDIIHQLNMIGFREPGYLWKIKDIPYIWGPIGNVSPLPISFMKGSSISTQIKVILKNIISNIQFRTGRVRQSAKRADVLLTALVQSANMVSKYYKNTKCVVMPESGLNITNETRHSIDKSNPIKLLWVGRFIPTKKLDFALEILSRVNNPCNFELHIVGWGNEEEEIYYKNIAKRVGVDSLCTWYGKIPNNQVQEMMKSCDVFLFTSLVEGTPHVILEAISNNLPILCFDICGQGVMVNDSIGWKSNIDTLSDGIDNMIRHLNDIDSNRNSILEKSKNCEIRKPELSWQSKISKAIEIYHSIIENNLE